MASLLSELFWFLLPLAALSGWYIGTRNKAERSVWMASPEYIASLNYLLNQQTSKAIDSLIKFFEVNATTVDTHIILGNLFREKGEVEKAITVHYNVVSRGNLSEEIRTTAMLELGRDYFYAGLLDKAEETFSELTTCDSRSAVRETYRNLIVIYEREKSWDKAIECARYLRNESEEEYRLQIAHYYCEMADAVLLNQDYKRAKSLAARAKSSHFIFRVAVLDADLEFMRGHHSTALHLYSNVLAKWPGYAQIVLPKLTACFPSHRAGECAAHLREIMPPVMTVAYISAFIRVLLEANKVKEAEDFAFGLIRNKCAPISMLRLFVENHAGDKGFRESGLTPYLIDALKLHRDDTGFACSACGFRTSRLYWQCPSCHTWEMAEPLDTVEPHPGFPAQ